MAGGGRPGVESGRDPSGEARRGHVLLAGPHVDGQREVLRALAFEAEDRGWAPTRPAGLPPTNRVFRQPSGWQLHLSLPAAAGRDAGGEWWLAGFDNASLIDTSQPFCAALAGVLFVTSSEPAIRAEEAHCLALVEARLGQAGHGSLPGRILRDVDPTLVEGVPASLPGDSPRYPERAVGLLTGQGVVAAFRELCAAIRAGSTGNA